MSKIRELVTDARAASHPFVQRVFRGRRGWRYAAFSLVLAALTLLFGMWLAWGSGDLERELRSELGLEVSTWERENNEFTLVTFDSQHYERAMRERQRLLDDPEAIAEHSQSGELGYMIVDAKRLLRSSQIIPAPPERVHLQDAAAPLAERYPVAPSFATEPAYFEWYDARETERLAAIIDADMVPRVELYSSPLGVREGFGVIGLLSGGVLLLALLVGAPLFAGAQIAQEAHENTLQPLLGTRLTPRGLVIGLTVGPLAAAAVLVAPQLAIFVACAALAGNTLAACGFLAITICATLLVTMVVQLLGYGMGRRWASGLVGTSLSVALVVSLIVAVAIGANIDDESAGLVAVVPQTGSVHLLLETFLPQARLMPLDAMILDVRMMIAAVGFVVLAGITVLALERRVTGRTQPALSRLEAVFAAITLVVLAVSVTPELDANEMLPMYFLTLGLLIIPFQVLLMGRVPIGDGPAKLRKIPLLGLLFEFAQWVALHGIVMVAIVWNDISFSLGGLFYLVWALGVAALCAVRVAATPLKPLAAIYVCFALFTSVVGYALAAAFFATASYRQDDLFLGFFEVSPILGLLQIVVTVGVPWSLLHALRRESAGFG